MAYVWFTAADLWHLGAHSRCILRISHRLLNFSFTQVLVIVKEMPHSRLILLSEC